MLPRRLQSTCQNNYQWDALEEVPERLDGIAAHFLEMGVEGGQSRVLHCFVTAARTIPEDQLRVYGGSFVFLTLFLIAKSWSKYQLISITEML